MRLNVGVKVLEHQGSQGHVEKAKKREANVRDYVDPNLKAKGIKRESRNPLLDFSVNLEIEMVGYGS